MFQSSQNVLLWWWICWTLFAAPAFSEDDWVSTTSLEFKETWYWKTESNGVRVVSIVPNLDQQRARKCLVLYATPNGSTIEQSLGCRPAEGLDWKYDIQHVAAQFRLVQATDQETSFVLAIVQAPALSWPEFRRTTSEANGWIKSLVATLQSKFQTQDTILSCHSGGGSFLWGWMNASERLPDSVSRIIFLDANYSFSESDQHGEKLTEWLSNSAHHLVVIAYDDREITLDGKKVIGSDGGTFRATERMRAGLSKGLSLSESRRTPFQSFETADRRLRLIVHGNPENKILHTALVGDMNGFAFSLLAGTSYESQVSLGAPRLYDAWINSKPAVDPRRSNAKIVADLPVKQMRLPSRGTSEETGSAFIERIQLLDRTEREQEIQRAVLRGNVPERARFLVPVQFSMRLKDQPLRTAQIYVAADYMSIGSDQDFVRIPMTPGSCLAIADSIDCSLLTPKLSDDVFQAATLRLAPKPLSVERESPVTFAQHHAMIEAQILALPREQQGVIPYIVSGIKKDIVWTRKLFDKANRVAIYGWHYPDGRPIQPVYAGHVDWYTDYSHGLRLIENEVIVDGNLMKLRDAMLTPDLHPLFSNEGPLDLEQMKRASQWKP